MSLSSPVVTVARSAVVETDIGPTSVRLYLPMYIHTPYHMYIPTMQS